MCALATIIPAIASASTLPEPQTRGYHFNLSRAMTPQSLELEISRVAAAGFNLVVFPVLGNGWTLYPSEAMHQYRLARVNPLFRKWNPLGELVAHARAGNLGIWGFARVFNFNPRHALAEHRLLHKYREWRVRAHPNMADAVARGRESWLPCPLNPHYRRHVADVLTELAAAYPVEGIVLDCATIALMSGHLREWPYCFCETCRAAYQRDHESDLIEDALRPARAARVRGWQLEQMHETLAYLRHRLLRTRRTLRVICRVTPAWRENPAFAPLLSPGAALADWPALLAEGELEEILVDHEQLPPGPEFGDLLAADLAYLGDRVLFSPMLALRNPRQLALPLRKLSRYPLPGFIGDFQEPLSEDAVHFIRERYFAEEAPLPESDPVRTAIYLLERVRLAHESQPRVHDFIADVVRLLIRQMPVPREFGTLQVLEQNLHGFEQFVRRGRLRPQTMLETTLRELGLARRFIRMACMDVRS